MVEKRKPGRPKQAVTKQHVTLRLDRSVVDAYRNTGKGWQTRMNADLRRIMEESDGR